MEVALETGALSLWLSFQNCAQVEEHWPQTLGPWKKIQGRNMVLWPVNQGDDCSLGFDHET